ncbi:MAG: riboflavin synthase [Pseudomonadota bacterium]
MFTGIITDVGTVTSLDAEGDGFRFAIECAYPAADIAVGASIACSGVCLTATTVVPAPRGSRFTADVSPETADVTTAAAWAPGTRLNLERSLKLGDEMGGHMVSGHVDGRATLVSRADSPAGSVLWFKPPEKLARFIAPKGSVALDGTSLTVNAVEEAFSVTLIPHTLAVTTWGTAAVGTVVNIEVDLFARYIARMADMQGTG